MTNFREDLEMARRAVSLRREAQGLEEVAVCMGLRSNRARRANLLMAAKAKRAEADALIQKVKGA